MFKIKTSELKTSFDSKEPIYSQRDKDIRTTNADTKITIIMILQRKLSALRSIFTSFVCEIPVDTLSEHVL